MEQYLLQLPEMHFLSSFHKKVADPGFLSPQWVLMIFGKWKAVFNVSALALATGRVLVGGCVWILEAHVVLWRPLVAAGPSCKAVRTRVAAAWLGREGRWL